MSSQVYTSNMVTQRAMKAEILDAETEQVLARAWRDEKDEKSLHRLINAYTRLAIAMAVKFKRYGNLPDLIQEAGVGLMKAADRFDPDRGVRFSTYAVWWIKASIQDHVMRNWSLVRTGSTSSQKSLFFNLKRVEAEVQRSARAEGLALDRYQIAERVAHEIGVSVADTEMMQGRLSSGDFSLNAQQGNDEESREWIDVLEDEDAQGAPQVEQTLDQQTINKWLATAMKPLSDREKKILIERKFGETPRTLEVLGQELGVSKERVRQLEVAALKKMRRELEPYEPALRQLLR